MARGRRLIYETEQFANSCRAALKETILNGRLSENFNAILLFSNFIILNVKVIKIFYSVLGKWKINSDLNIGINLIKKFL